MPIRRWSLLLALVLFALPAFADDYVVLVAPRDTPAAEAAQKLADDKTTFWFAKLHKALNKVGELLAQGQHTVTVKVVQSDAASAAGAGTWKVPPINNPQATLKLLGGWKADWSERDPFKYPTELLTGEGRPDPILSFSPKSNIGEIVISGFILDAAPSNKYDAKTNSLLKGSSRTIPLLGFSMVVTRHLVVADNVFLNGAHKAFDPYISPADKNVVVDIQNNFFLNNVIPMKLSPALYKGNTVKTMNLKNNSFILNWPFNPDPTSGNVGAIELYHKDCCGELNVEGNLFAYNAGGAMQHDWPTGRMPKMSFTNNLFFMNATLFGDARPEAGFFTGKFGPNPKHLIVTVGALEDDFDYPVKGNVSFDPEVPVAMVDLQAADSSAVRAKKTVMNDLRGLFGVNKQGGTVAIANYAPRMGFDPTNLPFPKNEKAKAFGVQAGGLYK